MSITGLYTASSLATAIPNTPTNIPSPSSDLTDQRRWQQVTVINQTQFTLLPGNTDYFDSGRYFTAPIAVSPFSQMTFAVCNKTPGFAGATGATSFVATLAPQLRCNIGVGFSSPEIGGYATNVAFDADHNQAQDSRPVLSIDVFTSGTYDNNTDGTVTTSSAQYTGADTSGAPQTIQFTASATAADEVRAVITQTIV